MTGYIDGYTDQIEVIEKKQSGYRMIWDGTAKVFRIQNMGRATWKTIREYKSARAAQNFWDKNISMMR